MQSFDRGCIFDHVKTLRQRLIFGVEVANFRTNAVASFLKLSMNVLYHQMYRHPDKEGESRKKLVNILKLSKWEKHNSLIKI